MSGLIAGAYDEARRAREGADTLAARLTAARAGYLDRLDHGLLDAVGPIHGRVTDLPVLPVVASGYSNSLFAWGFTTLTLANTGATLTPALSISGAGILWLAAVGATGGNSTIAATLAVDGTTLVTFPSTSITAAAAVALNGLLSGALGAPPLMVPLAFRSSLVIACASNSAYGRLVYHRALTGAPA